MILRWVSKRVEEMLRFRHDRESPLPGGARLMQIVDLKGKSFCAGEKAPEDVAILAEREGWRQLRVKRFLHPNRFLNFVGSCLWILCLPIWILRVPRQSAVLVPYPGDYLKGRLGFVLLRAIRRRAAKTIVFVHDFHELRTASVGEIACEQMMRNWILDIGDIFVVHNSRMRKWVEARLCEQGLTGKRLVELGLFDYLAPGMPKVHMSSARPARVAVAGSLDRVKAAYTRQLAEVNGIDWRLYGPGWDGAEMPHMTWHGVLGFTELVDRLEADWGLVWDGDSIETCAGASGGYLRINNPHKASLYLAAGLPVIVWSGSAVAEIVLSRRAGIGIENLRELPQRLAAVTPEDYSEFCRNAAMLGTQLRDGTFTRTALGACMLDN